MTRKLRDPNARLQRIGQMPVEVQLKEVREVLVDIWGLVDPFSGAQSGNYTITGNANIERAIMTNSAPATVTLPAFPADLQEVFVKRTDAQVTIDGNGNTIDGQLTKILGVQYDGAHMIYTDAAGEWSLI